MLNYWLFSSEQESIAMELRVFDHIVIGENQYFSFADKGLIEEYEIQAVGNMK